jgi:hypothetical protein
MELRTGRKELDRLQQSMVEDIETLRFGGTGWSRISMEKQGRL